MNRIERTFQHLRKQKRKAFVAYITAGDPGLAATRQLVLELEQAGADIIELGVPFSDPMADGPTIQAASQRALAGGTTLAGIFRTVARIRRQSDIPIALMTYYNPVFHFGEKRFIQACARVGVDGVIIPDLPPEEAGILMLEARRKDVATIFFLAPTTRSRRIPGIIKAATGFIYYVSLTGVTGVRAKLPLSITRNVKAIKNRTKKPVCVGFGISTREQVRRISGIADGVIVGSAIIKEIQKNKEKKDMPRRVGRFVARLTGALKR